MQWELDGPDPRARYHVSINKIAMMPTSPPSETVVWATLEESCVETARKKLEG